MTGQEIIKLLNSRKKITHVYAGVRINEDCVDYFRVSKEEVKHVLGHYADDVDVDCRIDATDILWIN